MTQAVTGYDPSSLEPLNLRGADIIDEFLVGDRRDVFVCVHGIIDVSIIYISLNYDKYYTLFFTMYTASTVVESGVIFPVYESITGNLLRQFEHASWVTRNRR